MQNKKVKLLVIVIGIMVLALIVIQFIWLQLDFSANRRAIDLRIATCLQSISSDVSNTEYCAPTYSKAFVESGERIYLLHDKHEGGLDTMQLFYDEKYTQDSLVGRLDYLRFRHPFKLEVTLNALLIESDRSSFLLSKSNYEEAKKTQHLEGVMGNTTRIDSVFDMQSIAITIKENLIKEHLDTNFSFAFITNDQERLSYFNNIADRSNLQKSKFRVRVFKDNPFMRNYYLHLYLPDRYKKNRILWYHLLPLLIVLFLLSALFLFAKLFFKQIHLNRLKSNFIHNVAHELNTPLANISLALETLADENVKRTPKVKTLLDIISTESGRLHENIEKSLHFARAENGIFHLQKETFDIIDLLNTVLISYRYKCQELGGDTHFNQTTPIEVYGDETHILNSIVNILDNSVKYRNGTPVIHVICREEAGHVEIEVKDNGIGMAPSTLKHAFDKFYRAPEGDEHNRRGFGLGLSYVKSIVSLHGGKIEVFSKLGEGATFIIHLNKRKVDGQTD